MGSSTRTGVLCTNIKAFDEKMIIFCNIVGPERAPKIGDYTRYFPA